MQADYSIWALTWTVMTTAVRTGRCAAADVPATCVVRNTPGELHEPRVSRLQLLYMIADWSRDRVGSMRNCMSGTQRIKTSLQH